MKLVNASKNLNVGEQVAKAKSFCARSKGLLGQKSLPSGHGLWIDHCPSIHTLFMNFAIDVVFVDSKLKVRARYENVKPWRFASSWGSRSVFELYVGAIAKGQIEVGDQLNVVP